MNFIPLKKKVYLSEILSVKKFFSKNSNYTFSSFSEFGTRKKNTLFFFDQKKLNYKLFKNLEALILTNDHSKKVLRKNFPKSKIVTIKNPRAIFIKILEDCFRKRLINNSSKFSPKTKISLKANIAKNVIVEPNVRIDENTFIGDGCIIKSGTWIKKNSIILENTVIGSDGICTPVKFNNKNLFFPHLAGVIIGKSVRIGSSCVVSKGVLKDTIIGNNTIIGNHCNIGHSALLEESLWISGGVLIGGYTSIGKKTNIGMGTIIKNGLKIGKKTNIGMGSVLTKSIANNSNVFGNPAKYSISLKAGSN